MPSGQLGLEVFLVKAKRVVPPSASATASGGNTSDTSEKNLKSALKVPTAEVPKGEPSKNPAARSQAVHWQGGGGPASSDTPKSTSTPKEKKSKTSLIGSQMRARMSPLIQSRENLLFEPETSPQNVEKRSPVKAPPAADREIKSMHAQ